MIAIAAGAFAFAFLADPPAAPSNKMAEEKQATTATTQSGPPPADRPTLSNVQIVRYPSPDELSSAYPKSADDRRIPGFVFMRCFVTPNGSLSNCEVKSEKPAGLGFGAAALEMTKLVQVAPYEKDGKTPTAGGSFYLGIGFRKQ